MDKPLIFRLFKTAKSLAQRTDLDPSTILMIALTGALVLLSVLITLLVWLRYLVGLGLVAVPILGVLRWKRSAVADEGAGDAISERAGGVEGLLSGLLEPSSEANEGDLPPQPAASVQETLSLRGTQGTAAPTTVHKGTNTRAKARSGELAN
jgi:hypothetical protein